MRSILGLYAVAVSLSRMVNIFSTSIIAVLFPKASGLEKEQAVALTFRVFRISTFVALLASVCLMIVAPFVFHILYGPEFKEALGVFRLLLLEVSIGGGTMVLAQVFMAMGKPKIVTLLQAFRIAVSHSTVDGLGSAIRTHWRRCRNVIVSLASFRLYSAQCPLYSPNENSAFSGDNG